MLFLSCIEVHLVMMRSLGHRLYALHLKGQNFALSIDFKPQSVVLLSFYSVCYIYIPVFPQESQVGVHRIIPFPSLESVSICWKCFIITLFRREAFRCLCLIIVQECQTVLSTWKRKLRRSNWFCSKIKTGAGNEEALDDHSDPSSKLYNLNNFWTGGTI